jgi:hypothetical protein
VKKWRPTERVYSTVHLAYLFLMPKGECYYNSGPSPNITVAVFGPTLVVVIHFLARII